MRDYRKKIRNIGQDGTRKFQNWYPLSGMLICPYCGKTLRRRQVYKKKIQWLCSTYIEQGKQACKGIRIDDAELAGLHITEQTVVEEVVKDGKKHYRYTSKAEFDFTGESQPERPEDMDGSVLPGVNRPKRTLSSPAQDESRSISENSTWGIRRRFETGKHKMSTKRFLGYDSDEKGKLIVNSRQTKIVVRLFQEFLDGKTTDYIKRIFEQEGVVNWDGSTKWHATIMNSMLRNEKYKGDALLQKSYTVDFLTKKRAKNAGEVQMYYMEDDHEAIIDPRIWECVQLEFKRREKYIQEHGTHSYSRNPETNPFASRIVCGTCNKVFSRKEWRSSAGYDRKVWQCSERYQVKGVQGCDAM